MQVSLKATGAGVLLVLSATLGGASAATASDSDSPTPDDIRSQYTNEELFYTPEMTRSPAEARSGGITKITMRDAAWVVQCTVDANAPHISKGAGGVIYKSRVSCTGTGDYPTPVSVNVQTALYHIPADNPTDTDDVNWRQYFGGGESRWIDVNGSAETFYAPHEGQAGMKGKGFWQGTSIITIHNPEGIKSGNDTSPVWFLDTTTS